MVYVNTFNSLIGVLIIIVLSSFIIFVAYLWVDNLQENASETIQEEIDNNVCDCLDIISDTGSQVVVMNVNCPYVENLTMMMQNNDFNYNETLYFEDFVLINYENITSRFVFTYNTCVDVFNR